MQLAFGFEFDDLPVDLAKEVAALQGQVLQVAEKPVEGRRNWRHPDLRSRKYERTAARSNT